MGFGSWFKNLLANILVFPAVALFILIGQILAQTGGPEWTPPVMGVSGGTLTALLGFGMLLLANKVPQMVKSAFKMAKPVDYGTAIGESLAPSKTAGKVIIGGGTERAYSSLTGTSGPGWAQPGQVGRGALDVVRSGVDKVLKKW